MRRRDVITLLGGTAVYGLFGTPTAWAEAAAAAAPQFPPWGFDLSGMDRSTKPGDDFFRYANGAWFDRTAIAPDRSFNGVSLVLTEAAERHTREILERGQEGVDASARADAVKFGGFYASFMDEARAESLDAEPIAPLLQRVRAANSRDDLAALMGMPGFTSSIFGAGIEIDGKKPDRYVVTVSQGGLGLPDRDYYLAPGFAEKKAAYRAYVAQILEMIGWPAPSESATAILDFETAIAKASWPLAETRDSDKAYNPMSEDALAQAAPFAWRALFQAASLPRLDHLVVAELTAIPKIAAIFSRTPVDTLKAWQAFHVADGAAGFLSKRFVAARFAFYGKTLQGTAELSPRWRRGVYLVNGSMGEAVGRVYVSRYFPAAAKAKVQAMVAEIRAAFAERLKRLTWMGSETKSRALEKLARFNVKIGYPNKWRDYSKLQIVPGDLVGNVVNAGTFAWMRKVGRLNEPVDRDEWDLSPQTVNAYYNPNLNEIVFPAAILQPPYFDPAADTAVNYGGIGAIIGHELTHGFDDDGRRYDGAGILSNWWTDKDLAEFQARTVALQKQFDAFEPFPGVHVNGALTLGENIADLGGALVALDAYHRSLAGKPAPVIDGLTGDQRFFLGFTQSWRDKARDDSLRQMLVSDPHAPERYRVNGVVRNIDAWYAAFNVQSGSKLALADERRVRIW